MDSYKSEVSLLIQLSLIQVDIPIYSLPSQLLGLNE